MPDRSAGECANSPISHKIARRECTSIDAICPYCGRHWEVLVSAKLIEITGKKGRRAVLELTELVRSGLLNIENLFRGIRDDAKSVDDDGWFCYTSKPEFSYNQTGGRTPRRANQIFVVYVTDERLVYNWAWIKCELGTMLPVDHSVRFKTRVF